jgi:effector-binding domain-containing protein
MKSIITIAALFIVSHGTALSKNRAGTITLKQNNNTTQQDTIKKPLIIIEKTIVKPIQVLFISDTARIPDVSKLFENDYAELFKFIFSNGLTPGNPMATHLTYEYPMQLEVAVPVNKVPTQLTGRIKSRNIDGGNAVVLHYTGNYEAMPQAYDSLRQWIKDNHIQPGGLSYEVYLNDPGSVKSKDDLKTDIYQPIQ